MKNLPQLLILLVVFLFAIPPVQSTNGYFSHAYGTIRKGMAGAGIAYPRTALDAALNPATLAFVGKRFDISFGAFLPQREFTVTGNPSGFPGTFPLSPGTVKSDNSFFAVPSVALNWMLSDNASFGVSLYGNGGMNTEYPVKVFNHPEAPVTSPTGVDLMQVFIAPNFSYRITETHALGITAILGYQRFRAVGLQAFGGFSSDYTKLTNNDPDNSYGFGFRVGYYGEFTPTLSIGASYQSRTFMSEFDKYSGLFAEQGDFDIPSNWTAGVAYRLGSNLVLALDAQQIFYSEINSVGNPMILQKMSPATPDGSPNPFFEPLGNDEAAGFGWNDMFIVKFGVEYFIPDNWGVRAGFSHGNQPIPESEVLFNIMAPGVIQNHATLGLTKFLGGTEFNLAFSYGFSNSVSGPNPMEAPGAQNIEIKMQQFDIELGIAF